jgi:hypothetical protein
MAMKNNEEINKSGSNNSGEYISFLLSLRVALFLASNYILILFLELVLVGASKNINFHRYILSDTENQNLDPIISSKVQHTGSIF